MLLTILLILIACLVFYNFYWKRRSLPPGPTPWPLLGNIWELRQSSTPYSAQLKWNKKYGSVYTYWMTEVPVVSVADYTAIQNGFVKQGEAMAGRYYFKEILDVFRDGRYGLVDTQGDLWKEQRRFTLHVLRDFGMGKNLMQNKIMAEITELFKTLNQLGTDQAVNIADYFDVCVGSIISALLFGFRYDQDRLEEYRSLKNILARNMRLITEPLTTVLFFGTNISAPIVKKIPIFRNIYQEMVSNRDQMFRYFDQQINEHKAEIVEAQKLGTFDMDEEPKDFVDAYLRAMQKHENKGQVEHFYSPPQLRNVVLDLFITGQETTSLTLTWTVLYILHQPAIQKRIHKELDSLGENELITLEAKSKLPYLCAVINESQRMTNLLPTNLLHETTRDVIVDGYKIAKGTCIVPQVSCVLYNEKIFPEPFSFKPERFLDENGELKKVDELIPFGVGKRACIGENLARMELFLVLANIYNNYEILPVDPKQLPTLEKRNGLTVQPFPFKCRILKRTKFMLSE